MGNHRGIDTKGEEVEELREDTTGETEDSSDSDVEVGHDQGLDVSETETGNKLPLPLSLCGPIESVIKEKQSLFPRLEPNSVKVVNTLALQ